MDQLPNLLAVFETHWKQLFLLHQKGSSQLGGTKQKD